jgi:hypothetical protein
MNTDADTDYDWETQKTSKAEPRPAKVATEARRGLPGNSPGQSAPRQRGLAKRSLVRGGAGLSSRAQITSRRRICESYCYWRRRVHRFGICPHGDRRDRSAVVNLDKLTYAGNLENLTSVEAIPRYRFVEGDICDQALVDSPAGRGEARRHRAFRRRIARGPQHSLAGTGDSDQPARHFHAARSRAQAPLGALRACFHRRSLRQPGKRRWKPTKTIR